MPLRSIALPLALMLSVAPALAQVASPTPAPAVPTEPRETIEGTLSQDRTVIAVPAFATPAVTTVAGLRTDNLGRQIADVIAADLERSGLYAPLGPGSVRAISMAEVRAPRFADWQARNAENVVHGFVQTNSTGGFVVGCYLYDTQLGSELVRQGFEIQPGDWRRAAHKCADAIYSRLSGNRPSSTAASPISPRAGRRGTGSSALRSWIRTAATTASSPMAKRWRCPPFLARLQEDRLCQLPERPRPRLHL